MREQPTTIDFNSSAPYYSQLKIILANQIESGVLRAGDELPSHSDLCEQYNVSRTVVRQALKELEYEGKIVQRKGKLASVATPKISGRLLERLSGTYQDLAEKGIYTITQTLIQQVITASEEIADRLEIDPGDQVIEIQRLRFVGDDTFVLVTSYLPYVLCPEILNEDLTNKSLLATLKSICGVSIASSRRSIETKKANAYEARCLRIKEGDPLLLFTSTSLSNDSQVMGCTRALFRGDRARFEVDLDKLVSKD
jgi:GntR family transcriptional regulator